MAQNRTGGSAASPGGPRPRAWLALVAVIAAAAALVACGSSDSSGSGGGASGDARTLTVGIPVDDASYAPLYLAQDRGFFAEHGIEVKLVVFKGGAELAKAVVGGSVDVAVSALSEMLLAVEQGQDLKAFYGGYNQTSFAWYAQKDIDSVRAAEGKRWGVTKVGSSTDFLTRYLLERNGIDPQTGATIIGVGPSAAQIAALKAKQIDVTSASNLTAYQLEALGYPQIAKQSDFAKEYPNHVAFSKEELVEQRRDDVLAFLKAQAEGMQLTRDDPQAAIQAISERLKVEPELAKRAYDDNLSGWDVDGRLPGRKAMDVYWQIGIQNGQWDAPMPESEWLDPQFIDTYAEWGPGGPG